MRNLLYLLAFVFVIVSCEKSNNDNNDNDKKKESKSPLAANVLAGYLPDAIEGFPEKTEILTGVLPIEDSITTASRKYYIENEFADHIFIGIMDYAGSPTALLGEKGTLNSWEYNPANTLNTYEISGFPAYELNAINDHVIIKVIVADRFLITGEYVVESSVTPAKDFLKTVLTGMNLAGLAEFEE